MTRTTITSTVAALALVVAAPAAAAEISAQRTVAEAGDKAPVTVGGTGLKKGSTLKQGQTMIARKFTLEGREKASLVLKCANGSVPPGRGRRGTATTRGSPPASRATSARPSVQAAWPCCLAPPTTRSSPACAPETSARSKRSTTATGGR